MGWGKSSLSDRTAGFRFLDNILDYMSHKMVICLLLQSPASILDQCMMLHIINSWRWEVHHVIMHMPLNSASIESSHMVGLVACLGLVRLCCEILHCQVHWCELILDDVAAHIETNIKTLIILFTK